MNSFILYLLEASAILAFFYLLYVLVLRRETFFSLNRFYLIGILAFSLLFPTLSFDFNPSEVAIIERPIEDVAKARQAYYEALDAWTYSNYGVAGDEKNITGIEVLTLFNWFQLAMYFLIGIYIVGIVICLSRTIWTLQWILSLVRHHPVELINGISVVKVEGPIAPFSFMRYVFCHHEMVGTAEFDHILAHERTHVEQRHSIDLIFVQLLAAFLWFNPVIWLLIKSLKTTHEYIADSKIINTGYSLVEYQTLLLRQLISNNSHGLVHNFNLSFIKKRITMMKNQKSGWSGKVKVAMALASTIMFSVLIVQCNSALEDQSSIDLDAPASAEGTSINLPILPDTEYGFQGSHDNSITLELSSNQLHVNGTAYEVDQLESLIDQANMNNHGMVIMRIDKNQSMGFVHEVQTELRRVNRRKLLYVGQTAEGKAMEMGFLLPPLPGSTYAPQLPTIDDAYIAQTGIDVLRINLDREDGLAIQSEVTDLLNRNIAKGSSNYAVGAKALNDTDYGHYLLNLTHIQNAFDKIYQDRAREMFGVNFFDLDKSDPVQREQYDAVRKGIPRAISVSEPEE
jgi:biopolymer transport protein ExbD